jgi:hypothetical protein
MTCLFCDKPMYKHNVCKGHYVKCKVPDCGFRVSYSGYCHVHAQGRRFEPMCLEQELFGVKCTNLNK